MTESCPRPIGGTSLASFSFFPLTFSLARDSLVDLTCHLRSLPTEAQSLPWLESLADLLRLPTLAHARAPFPDSPSSLSSPSAVSSSPIPDQPSWVPRRRECATCAEWVDASREDGSKVSAMVFGLVACCRNCQIEEDDGDGGR